MKHCRRSWEVEAERDGRLTADERLQFERHLRTCRACKAVQQELEALSDALRAAMFPQPDELALRRTRQELLARAQADWAATSAEEGLGQRRWQSFAAASLFLACGLILWPQAPSEQPTTATRTAPSPPTPTVHLTPDAGARYQRQKQAGAEVITLSEGRITLRVHRHAGEGKLIVRTPDAEIQDIGTVFAVSVSGAHTRSVEVFEGHVFVRMAGKDPREVDPAHPFFALSEPLHEPSQRQPADRSEQADAIASAPRPSLEPSSERRPAPGGDESSEARRPARAPGAMRSVTATVAAEPRVSEAAFRTAVALLDAGDNQAAASQLDQFVRAHVDNPHAEDAAYLRIVALLRLGDAGGARSAAHAYLARFPGGFRAHDVERLLEPGSRRVLEAADK